MGRIEGGVIGALLVCFVALLSIIAIATGIWPLWIPNGMLVWAFLIHVGIA